MITRAHVEQSGLAGVEVQPHELGLQCRILNRYWLVVDPEDQGFTQHARNDGFWEAWITAWMMNALREDTAFIDVGANVGYYTFLALDMGCRVYAFEPQRNLAERIAASALLNGNADKLLLEVAAVGAERSKMQLSVPKGHGMNASITQESASPTGEYDRYEVFVTPLDALVNWRAEQPLLIKIDAEGAEELVWRGMQQLFTRALPTTFLLEFRWDRYADPLAFARTLFDRCTVAHVDWMGDEQYLTFPEVLANRPHEDWMLVLRPRPETT